MRDVGTCIRWKWRGSDLLRRIVYMLAVTALPLTAHAEPFQSRQQVLHNMKRSIDELWEHRVDFEFAGTTYSGFATITATDAGEPFWGDESGSLSDQPLWDFQGSFGIPGATMACLYCYEATGNRAYLRRAQALGDTLLQAQDDAGAGWFYDYAIVAGTLQHIGVWGTWGNRVHAVPELQGWSTLDDLISQSSAQALLRLYQASGDIAYLNGAKRFADMLIALPTQQVFGIYPYADGGIPQGLPVARVATVDYNQNLDPRSPHNPYMLHKTLNDDTMSSAIIFLIAMYEETNDVRYRDAVRLHVDYLLDRFYSNGTRGWAQQYHYRYDTIAWGREAEPPAFVTTENHVVDALLLWRSIEPLYLRRLEIEVAVHAYLDWLHALKGPAGAPTLRWRYYNSDPSVAPVDEVVFADDFIRYFGEENQSQAGPGQPNAGNWDNVWNARLRHPDGTYDADLGDSRLADIAELPLNMIAANWGPTPENPTAGWYSDVTLNGQQRRAYITKGSVFRIYGLAKRFEVLGGAITDSDGDGFADAIEAAELTDSFDSDETPNWIVGDVNCDGVLNFGDIPAFIAALTNAGNFSTNYPNCNIIAADANADATISVADISAFVERMTMNN